MNPIIVNENVLDYTDAQLNDLITSSYDDIILVKNLPDDKQALSEFVARIGTHNNQKEYFFTDPDEQSITRVTNKRVDGQKIGLFADLDLAWHCHGHTRNVVEENTLLLYCSSPGDPEYGVTGFCNSRKAYNDLSESMKYDLDRIEVRMDLSAFMGEIDTLYKNDGGYRLTPDDPEYPIFSGKISEGYESTYKETWKPLVFVHPVDGKRSLHFCPSFIVNWDYEGDGESLWNTIYDHLFSDTYCYYHTWEQGDMIISDQRASLHNRTEVQGDRLLYRFCVNNENL